MQQIGGPMPSHHALLPASKEVILDIQLNKLINDFLFSSVEDHTATTMADDYAKGSKLMPMNGNPSWEMSSPSWKMGCPSYPSGEMGNPSWKMGNPSYPSGEMGNPSWNMGSSLPIPAVPPQIPSNVPTPMPSESNGILNNSQNDRCPSSTEEIRINVLDQERVFGDEVKASSSNNLKFLHLSKVYSEASSPFCLAMEALKHEDEEEERKVNTSSIKLTRMGSLPCHSKLDRKAETEVKHTCRKPPRPPRSSSEKRAFSLLSRCPSETILVLHSSSRRAKLERTKRLAAASSSTTSMWALIFTFCCAVAMIGQGFWSQGIHTLAMEASNKVAPADSHIKSNIPASSMDSGVQSNVRSPGQLEKEMQMRAFWVSKGLDPA